MLSADLLLMARQRAGLTQSALARRSGYPRETIARWEAGRREPSFSTMLRVVRSADLDLVPSLVRADDSLLDVTRDQLSASVDGRLEAFGVDVAGVASSLAAFSGADVPTVLIGQLAAAIQGDAQRPNSVTPTVVSEDPKSLARHLESLGLTAVDDAARWRAADTRATWVGARGVEVSIATDVPGTGDFPDLRRNARPFALTDSLYALAHPRDLLRIAEASPRDEERSRAPGLRALLEVLEEPSD